MVLQGMETGMLGEHKRHVLYVYVHIQYILLQLCTYRMETLILQEHT